MTDEIQTRLERGTSLLGAGEAAAARAELRAALSLAPEDPGIRGLLAQAEFRLGEYEAAGRIYAGLVRDQPSDPALHVNLGLSHLKAGRLDEAVRAFRDACDLAPDHRKARRYLGLALASRGEPAAAREEFLRAGEEAMVRRMDRLLAGGDPDEGEGISGTTPGPGIPSEPSGPEWARSAEPEGWSPRGPGSPEAGVVAPGAADAGAEGPAGPELAEVAAGELARLEIEEQPFAAAPASEAEEGWEVGGTPVEPLPPTTAEILPLPRARIPTLSAFLELARLPLPPEGPFATGAFGAAIEVRDGILTRLDGVYAARGSLHFEPVRKHFRGRDTEAAFGEGERQVFHATGRGSLLVSPEAPEGGPRTLTAVRLDDEEAFFCEEPVFAFDEALERENGRVPGEPGDLALVRLRGTGQVLLATARRVRTLRVAGEPLRVPASRLVGWTGTLAPRLLPFGGAADGPGIGVELEGEGDVLLAP